MTDQALSQQLNQWKTRLNTITSNVLDLYGAESSKVIRARLRDPVNGFSGITKARAARAIEVLDDLVDLYTRLAHVVDEAASLLGKGGSKGGVLRNNEERVKELLTGQSVLLDTQHVLVRNRGLLDEGDREVRATPAEVLATMEQSFAEARDGVTAIADAMAHVEPRLSALGQKITVLDSWAKTLGVARPAAFLDTTQLVARVASDPLGCTNEVDRIEAAVAQWRAELGALDTDRKAVLASLERGIAALAELRDLVARSEAAYAEAREKIVDPSGLVPPIGHEAVETLDTWLRALEQNAAAGRVSAVKVGMAKWEQTYSDRLEAERASFAHNSALLDERTELRGRFTALCAKADALKSRGVALGDTVETARRQGKRVLDAIPFDLGAGKHAVKAFEAALSAAPK
jgi:hypothetical protein